MHLALTQYLDAATDTAEKALEGAVDRGLDAAAARIAATRSAAVTDAAGPVVQVRSGLAILDGSELRVSGEHRLTTLEVVVPWTAQDSDGKKLLAASTFIDTVASELARAS